MISPNANTPLATPRQLDREDQEERKRRPLWPLLLLPLLLLCLCSATELTLRLIHQRWTLFPASALSRLEADYAPWGDEHFAPLDPALIATIKAEQHQGVLPTLIVAPSTPLGTAPSLAEITTPPLPTRSTNAGSPTSTTAPDEPTATAAAATRTSLPSVTPGATSTTLPTNTTLPTVTTVPTDTVVPTVTAAPPTPVPPTPTVIGAISGVLRDDVNYPGGDGTAAGVCNASLQGVTVELWLGAAFVSTTTTDANCRYTFYPPGVGVYTVVVDADTISGPGGAYPEQTYEFGNGGVGARGGDDPNIQNDHRVDANFTGASVLNVDFGFSYELVANTLPTGQGSLDWAIDNVIQIPGPNEIAFAIFGAGPHTIQPPAFGYPALSVGNITIDGDTQELTSGVTPGPDIIIDGTTVNNDINGFVITAGNITLNNLQIENYVGGTSTAIEIDNANNTHIEGCVLTNNIAGPATLIGQILIEGDSDNGEIINNTVTNGGGDGIRMDIVTIDDWDITGNTVTGNATEGITARGTGHYIFDNVVANNTGQAGVAILDDAIPGQTTGVTVSQNSIFDNGGPGIDLDMDGVTPNGPGVGPNNLLDYPDGWGLIVGPPRRVVANVPLGAIVEFFIAAADPTGFGEGQTYLFSMQDGGAGDSDGLANGSINVNIDNLPTFIVSGALFTTTATDPLTGDTSEFSANQTVP